MQADLFRSIKQIHRHSILTKKTLVLGSPLNLGILINRVD